jgi:transcriptional regulator with XRE-family HTH domain
MTDTEQWLTKDMRRRIGWRIKEIREFHLQVDQKGFAERIGSNQSTVSRMERGKILPSVEAVLRISEISDKTTDWILKGVE